MPRNLDIATLRSFVAVADTGGVTRASVQMNLTQSAVSMQLKRLEEQFGLSLLDRSARTIALTSQGEQLLVYARRLLELNDEAWGRMTNKAFEGEIAFGAPHDVIYPHIPGVLQRFAAEYPRVRVMLRDATSKDLKAMFTRGEMDLIMTTERGLDSGGETLAQERLAWIGAARGNAWRQRPIPLAAVSGCMFRQTSIEALEERDLSWRMAAESDTLTAVEASVSADLAIQAQLEGTITARFEVIRHGGALPRLPVYCINMYVGNGPRSDLSCRLAEFLRQAYCCAESVAAE